MTWAEKMLVLALWLLGLVTLTAVFAVVMPAEWMAAIHRRLGLGELPEAPIVGYLTRSISALYALQGALVLYLSLNVQRNLPVVKCLAALVVVFGAVMLGIDCAVGMPVWWIVGEGPPVVAMGIVLLWLAGRMERQPSPGRQ